MPIFELGWYRSVATRIIIEDIWTSYDSLSPSQCVCVCVCVQTKYTWQIYSGYLQPLSQFKNAPSTRLSTDYLSVFHSMTSPAAAIVVHAASSALHDIDLQTLRSNPSVVCVSRMFHSPVKKLRPAHLKTNYSNSLNKFNMPQISNKSWPSWSYRSCPLYAVLHCPFHVPFDLSCFY